jgi:hypothetical protein
MLSGPDPAAASERDDVRWWWCNADDKHPVSPVGELTEIA